jgi:hypothetical protein
MGEPPSAAELQVQGAVVTKKQGMEVWTTESESYLRI